MSKNFTARKNALPASKAKGRHPENGDYVRALERTYNKKLITPTRPDGKTRWKDGKHTIKAHLFFDLVLSDKKPGSASFGCVVIFDPRYHEPLILVTNLAKSVSARDVWLLYRDRWPIEQMPLSAKQMLGAMRSFVFATDSRVRLAQLALFSGNVLSYVAASSAPVASGFWDRACRPTLGSGVPADVWSSSPGSVSTAFLGVGLVGGSSPQKGVGDAAPTQRRDGTSALESRHRAANRTLGGVILAETKDQ